MRQFMAAGKSDVTFRPSGRYDRAYFTITGADVVTGEHVVIGALVVTGEHVVEGHRT